MSQDLTPSQIVNALNKHIVGQLDAKKAVAIALRNRWRRLNTPADIREDIVPNNILMIGATGVGKTEIARRLAALVNAPFVKVEASKFTEVGYVGRDVESMIRDLVEQAIHLVRAEHRDRVQTKAAERAEDRLLELLLPLGPNPDEGLKATREKMRAKLRAGEMDHRRVEVDLPQPAPNLQFMMPQAGGMEGGGMDSLQDLLKQFAPNRTKKQSLPVPEALERLKDDEANRLVDQEAIQREALERAAHQGIVFLDELDKVVRDRGATQGPDVSREGVQRDLLPIVEGSSVSTKYGPIRTDHVLFIAAGAFHVSKPADMIPELQGRFPIRVELQALTKNDFVAILRYPRSALTKQYQALLAAEGVELVFEDDSLEAIAEVAYTVNQTVEDIGARRLHTVLSQLLDDVLFTVPDLATESPVVITAERVHQRLDRLLKRQDLSGYIL